MACVGRSGTRVRAAFRSRPFGDTSELDRVGLELAAFVELRQIHPRVLPYEEHRALGREALVADVGRHRGHVAGLHQDAGARPAGLAVADVPFDLVGELDKPLDPIVPVDDGKDVFLGGRAIQRFAADRGDRRIPGDIRAAQILEQAEGVQLAFEAGLDLDDRFVLRHVGEGTVMTFDLAFQRSALPPEVPDSSIPAALTTGLQHLRILLVEDTYFNQLLAIELLKSKIRDVEIDVAENGQIALDKLDAQSYDLVLMDVKMPVMDGLEATRRIRRHPDDRVRSLPVVGLTASAVKEELEKCRIAGMNRWVTKPIQTEELLEAIQETIPPDLATTQFFFS